MSDNTEDCQSVNSLVTYCIFNVQTTGVPVVATVTEVVDPENATLPQPFAQLDPDTGILTYSPGQSVDTVFPCKYM